MGDSQSLPRPDSSTDDRAPCNPVDALAESFVTRLRRGERPSITQYVRQHPELEEEIRDLFPTLAMLEQLAPDEPLAGSPSASEPTEGMPRQLGPYRILREVGRGGMGVVFEAEHEMMRRRVALKVLPLGSAVSGTHLERFQREARSAGRLHHTNIVPVFEVGSHDGIYYYAMQFIQGQSLDLVFDELRRLKSDREETLVAERSSPAPARVEGPAQADRTGPDAADPVGRSVAAGLLTGNFQKSLSLIDDEEPDGPAQRESAERGGARPVAAHPVPAPTGGMGSATLPAAGWNPRGLHPASGLSGSSGGELLHPLPESSTPVRDDYYRRVASLGLQAAEAIAYAHGHGIIHRDIKPSNLILDTAGVLWVTDFGLAKNEGENLTRSGDVVGTLRYMAPERLQGRGDARSDVYGLGLTLYEFCTLRHAVDESDQGRLLQQVAHGEPARPRRIDPQIPRDLETIVLKAIEKDPARRYASAQDLADDLRLFIVDRPIRARRISAAERVWRWCRRNPRQASLMASVLVLLAIVLAGSLGFAYNARRQALALAQETLRSNRWLYHYCVGQAEAGRWSGRPGQRVEGLDAIRRAVQLLPSLELTADEERAQRLRLRNQAIACLPLIDLNVARRAARREGESPALAFDAEYSRYARSDQQGNVTIRDARTDRDLAYLPGPGQPAWILQFSPRGDYLAAKHHSEYTPSTLQVWNVSQSKLLLQFKRQHQHIPLAFDRSGERAAVGLSDGRVLIHRLEDGKLETELHLPRPATALAFQPQTGNLTIIDRSFELRLQEDRGPKLRVVRLPGAAMSLGWSGDGKRLVIGAQDHNIYDFPDLVTRPDDYRVLEGHGGAVVHVTVHPDGKRLASSSWDGSSRLWNLPSGRQLLWMDMATIPNAHFTPDGRRLAFVSALGGWGVWELDDRRPFRALDETPGLGGIWSVDFFPGHPRLVVCGRDRGLEFLDLDEGRVLATIPARRIRTARFSRDGKSLLTSGSDGVHRRSLEIEPNNGLRVGPPEIVRGDFAERMDLSRDERTMVLDRGIVRAEIFGPGVSAEPVVVSHGSLDRVALSPDGRWLVTATWQGRGVRVWDARDGTRICDLLPEAGSVTPAFSPDGRWLAATDGHRYHVWQVENWKPVLEVERELPDGWPGPLAFSPDSRLLAVVHSRQILALLDVRTGQTIAKLESPAPGVIRGAAFSRDGSRLAVVVDQRIQVWDLRSLRKNLRQLQLDWTGPAPAADPRPPSPAQGSARSASQGSDRASGWIPARVMVQATAE